jgi:probable HAF family extracellular repeat protein
LLVAFLVALVAGVVASVASGAWGGTFMRRLLPLAAVVLVWGVALAAGTASSSMSADDASTREPTTSTNTRATEGKWVITDLGTLGKKDEQSEAVAINERGQIVGNRYVVLSVSETQTANFGTAFVWKNGKMRDLGTLSGVQRTWPPREVSGAVAINDQNAVVGWIYVKSGEHTFLWKSGRMTDLGALPAGTWSVPVDLNDRGEVAGVSGKVPEPHAFVWKRGRMADLGTLGGPRSFPSAINERNQIVGWSDRSCVFGPGRTLKTCSARPFLWQNGKMSDLGSLGGHDEGGETGAAAINNRGWVVGSSYTAAKKDYGPPIEHAFLWRDGKMTDLSRSALKQRESRATAINERGVIIGITSRDLLQSRHAFVWREGKMVDLGTLAGANGSRSEPFDINDRGYVVGQASTEAEVEHAFVWVNGVMTDLGTLPGGGESRAVALNERNQIVGWADTKKGNRHAVLWTQQPTK